MTVASGEGVISLPEDHLRAMLADCARFRTLTGASTQAQALNRIHIGGPPEHDNGAQYSAEELARLRPYAVIYTEQQEGGAGDRISTSAWRHHGALWMVIEQNCPERIGENFPRLYREFNNTIGVIITEMIALSSPPAAGYLDLRAYAHIGPERTPEPNRQEEGDAITSWVRWNWG